MLILKNTPTKDELAALSLKLWLCYKELVEGPTPDDEHYNEWAASRDTYLKAYRQASDLEVALYDDIPY